MSHRRTSISDLLFSAEWEAAGVEKHHHEQLQNDFLKELGTENDRSVVIVGASYIEELTRRIAMNSLSKGEAKARNALLDGAGPLSIFSARINLLNCLGVLDRTASNDLHSIRKLRNYCVHNWVNFAFSQEIEDKYCKSFTNFLNVSQHPNLSDYTARTQFVLVCAFYALTLNYKKNES